MHRPNECRYAALYISGRYTQAIQSSSIHINAGLNVYKVTPLQNFKALYIKTANATPRPTTATVPPLLDRDAAPPVGIANVFKLAR